MSWSEAQVETLTEMFKAGKSSAVIADAIGGGATKNSVISKLHRMGLAGNTTPGGRSNGNGRRNRHRNSEEVRKRVTAIRDGVHVEPSPVVRVKTDIPEPTPLMLPLEQLTGSTCKWAVTEVGPHRFCGNPSLDGRPWCEHHASRAFTVQVPRVRQRAYR